MPDNFRLTPQEQAALKADLKAEVEKKLPTNHVGAITAADLREVLEMIVDKIVSKL